MKVAIRNIDWQLNIKYDAAQAGARTFTAIRARIHEQSDLRRRLPALVQSVSVFRNWNLGKSSVRNPTLRTPSRAVARPSRRQSDCCGWQLCHRLLRRRFDGRRTSIADIDRLMDELQRARDFLQSEGERLRKMTASYANLAQTASASAKIIAESLGKWRDDQGDGSRTAMPGPHALSLSPDQDLDAQRKDH